MSPEPELPHFVLSEELKEALLRAKGQSTIILVHMENGKVTLNPDAWKAVRETDDRIVLKKIKPETPTKEKRKKVRRLAERLAGRVNIEVALQQALLEKTDEQLDAITAAEPGARIERRRGCFWLITEKEEVLL